jgi:23S rRNA pseudouridine1911/1915/1917 synthase
MGQKRRTYYDWSPICDEARIEKTLLPDHRLISVTIGPDGAHDLRLDQYLAAALRTYPRSLLRQWFRNGYISNTDGKKIKASGIPAANATFFLRLPHPKVVVAVDAPLDILYQDDDCLLVNKPPGQLPHPAGKQMTGTLFNRLQDWATDQGDDPNEIRLVNRIDKDTSGLVLISRHQAAHSVLATALRAHQLDKRYQALCVGVPDPQHGDWRDPLEGPIDPDVTIAQRVTPDGKASHTGYAVRATATTNDGQHFAWLDIELFTGRQHQIRLHGAHNGHALLGDWLYGQPIIELGAQALHAWRLTFPRPADGQAVTVEAPLCGRIKLLWYQLEQGLPPTPRLLSSDERSKKGLPIEAEDEVELPDGWRRPSWMSDAELRDLISELGEEEID